ncbi:DNA damage-regulated autophagy modulator protein 2-like isoform X2 [Centruroides sculpturatus]|uniref:DNA damage-regulated autophagy modulator protein 2-like isoform X2 n=1 Tax=Centruroides sculpturatus TaxID=218467 RepID=UPI000C6E42E4|nr:DNA damage-regulated autophagy modulator protein 2-like isoform X2 [Centruroides sculpturatus]
MTFTKVYLLPLSFVAILFITFATTFTISVRLKHVTPIFPYISDTGTKPPESTIFGQMLNVSSVIIFVCLHLRYLQVNEILRDPNLPHHQEISRLNRICYSLSFFVSLGLSIVANFQETVLFPIHIAGACLLFTGAITYNCIQVKMCFKLIPRFCSLKLAKIRLFLSVLQVLTGVSTGVFMMKSLMVFNKPIQQIPLWTPEDEGYQYHVASTISEWILVTANAVSVGTNYEECKTVILIPPKVQLINGSVTGQLQNATSDGERGRVVKEDRSIDQIDNNLFTVES